MNRDDIKQILQKGHRVSLEPSRKAALRERLIASMHEETESSNSPTLYTERQDRRHSPRVIASSRTYLYPVAGIIAAAGMAGVVAVTFGIGSGGQSSSTSSSSTSTQASSSASSSSNSSSSSSSNSNSSSSSSATSASSSSPSNASTNGSSSGKTSPASRAQTNAPSTPANNESSAGTNGANHQASIQSRTSKTSSASNGAMMPSSGSTSNSGTQSNGVMHASNALMQPSRVVRTVAMGSATDGWAIDTANHILRTTDGGKSWTDVTPSMSEWKPNVSGTEANTSGLVHFSHGNLMAFAGSTNGSMEVIYVTADGGKSWQHSLITVPTNCAVQQIQMLDANQGFLVVQSTSATNGTFDLYRTNDGGISWHLLSSSSNGALSTASTSSSISVQFTSASAGWRLAKSDSGKTIVETTADGGRSWQTWASNLVAPKDLQKSTPIYDSLPTFFGQKGIWAVPYSNSTGSVTDMVIYTSMKGEKSWQPGTPVTVQSKGAQVDFPSASVGWISDPSKGQFHVTTDGGETWHTVQMPSAIRHADAFDFIDASHGFAMVSSGNQSSMYVTANGGKTWTLQPTTFVDTQAKQ